MPPKIYFRLAQDRLHLFDFVWCVLLSDLSRRKKEERNRQGKGNQKSVRYNFLIGCDSCACWTIKSPYMPHVYSDLIVWTVFMSFPFFIVIEFVFFLLSPFHLLRTECCPHCVYKSKCAEVMSRAITSRIKIPFLYIQAYVCSLFAVVYFLPPFNLITHSRQQSACYSLSDCFSHNIISEFRVIGG